MGSATTVEMKQRLAIIGNGMAGARFCAELVARGGADRFDITIFGEEPGGAYNRILLSDVLNGSREAGAIETHSLDWFARNNITLRAGEKITFIDRDEKTLTSDRGRISHYDSLVLATGSRALVPPMDGLHSSDGERKKGIFVLRTLADCDRVANYARKATRAVVVGGGLLGLEAARGLMQHGAQVGVVHRSGCLMSAQLDQSSGDMLRHQMEMMGINVHLNKATTAILGDECAQGLAFRDGTELRADMVVLACGIVPNIELARDAGFEVNKGIEVDDALRVQGDENTFAIGECAEHQGQVYGLVAPAWEQARVLALRLSGHSPDALYTGSKTSTKLKVMGVELASIGTPREAEGDEVVTYAEPSKGRYKKLIIRDNRLKGAILLGDVRKAAVLQQAFDRSTPLPDERATLFFDIGRATNDIADFPDDATVCNCNGVSAGTLRATIQEGAASVETLMAQTKAGTGCGTCKSSLKALLAAKG
ncbi:nitrite reductase [NAD(P)H] [Abditibacteriota bacterium]|nr:nitrite reductase [NAD(P)H] [Abditibacteriota bacterium]